MNGFPHLVEMQKKHGPDGLVVMTINIDDAIGKAEDKATRQRTNRFLDKFKNDMTCLVLADGEKMDDWNDKLMLGAFPVCFLYGRDGKLAKRLELAEPDMVAADVRELLAGKR